MALNRNFRTTYYKTLGVPVVPHIVDLEASYHALLHEPVVNLAQVLKLASEVGMSATHRTLVWKLLCGLLPVYPSLWEHAEKERAEMYRDLIDAAHVLMLLAAGTMQGTHEHDLWRLHRIYWIEVMRKAPLHGMHDELYLAGIAKVVLQAVSTTPMEQFWCFTSILQVLDRAQAVVEPNVLSEVFYDISVAEFEVYFLRALECVRTAARL